MKRLTRKIGVSVMAASFAISSSLVAFAADPAGTGTAGGTGGIEGIVKTDVYTAVLPTASTTAYNYIADPQGLIRKTNAAKYSGATFGEGSIFFANEGGSYSNTSNAAKIVNQSSKNLSVTVTAKATAASDGATLASSSTFSGTDKEVYLGIIDSVEGNAEAALTGAGTTMTAVLGAAPEEAYEYSYDEEGYKYTLKSDISSFQFAEYSFQITGAANDKATDWAANTALPEVEVTWTVDLTDDAATVATPAQEAAPSAPATANYSKTNGLEIPVNLGSGKLAADGATVQIRLTEDGELRTPAGISYADGKITIPGNQWPAAAVNDQRWVVVTFNDSAKTQKTIVLTVVE